MIFLTSILCRVLSRFSKVKTGAKRGFKALITAHDTQWKNVYDVTGKLKKADAYFDSARAFLKFCVRVFCYSFKPHDF